ncbi:hypothetical protein EVAR_81097_1 [Eumeta japonica]|uniref:Uncharacterized protein n=1 Tax=Eumeta variegata TaxID=151549 RepID=A0A4C1T8T4_EUMVA|nr:hypothetical protein EVAR_81097_1 [Eumeta japonica]
MTSSESDEIAHSILRKYPTSLENRIFYFPYSGQALLSGVGVVHMKAQRHGNQAEAEGEQAYVNVEQFHEFSLYEKPDLQREQCEDNYNSSFLIPLIIPRSVFKAQIL